MDRDRRITREELKAALNEAYRRFKDNNSGKNADYIPYLANVDKNLFGISVCLKDGEVLSLGDCNYRFGIESISKVATALLVLKEYGPETIIDMIGADATGMPFNSILAILLENEHPSTPLVNAGAISAVSMVRPVGNSRGKWENILQNITELCGSEPQLINELYKSESVSNHNNRAIAWMLKGYDRIYDDPELSLDLYTRQCSLGVTAAQLGDVLHNSLPLPAAVSNRADHADGRYSPCIYQRGRRVLVLEQYRQYGIEWHSGCVCTNHVDDCFGSVLLEHQQCCCHLGY